LYNVVLAQAIPGILFIMDTRRPILTLNSSILWAEYLSKKGTNFFGICALKYAG